MNDINWKDIPIEICFENQDIVVVNKPSGLLVHRTNIDKAEKHFLLQLLRDQLGYHLYPIHRLDKATSGLVLFAKSSEAAKAYQNVWQTDKCIKKYKFLARGWLKKEITVDYAIEEFKKVKERTSESQGQKKEAKSLFTPLEHFEIDVDFGKFPVARYSLVEAQLFTGRRHQIRRHACHLSHPIIGDSNYGDGKHNRFFRENLGITGLLLQSYYLELFLINENKPITIENKIDPRFEKFLNHPTVRRKSIGID
jgi:tRNA pseudouridine65 synthase